MFTIGPGSRCYRSHFEEKVTEAPAASTTFKPRWELPKPVASRSPYSLCFDVSLSLQRQAGQNFVLATRVVCTQNLHFLSLKSSLLPQQPRSTSVLWLMFAELQWGGCCKNINTWVFFWACVKCASLRTESLTRLKVSGVWSCLKPRWPQKPWVRPSYPSFSCCLLTEALWTCVLHL